MKLFLKIFVLIFLVDIILGFSMSYFTENSEPNFLFKIIDEIISFPVSLWNRLVPDQGIYAATTNVFWLVVFFNAFVQALVIYGVMRFVKKKI
ncbi:hypothetical protein [uncultured Winogradskyella sp.]|uniref:hypothetical protein n=1 Tax=uncultured Winogradskyella sp. TaxID=395353 RepID=UPI00261B4DBC|nr:hypothetical protein [uncultured Winogradskyella sp.]